MKIEEKITKMKKVYHGTTVSDDVVNKEWQALENVLGKQHSTYVSPVFFRAFAFAAVVLLLSGGVVTLAQASKPGEFLYPVKEISQKVVEEVKKSVPVFIQSDQKVKGITDKKEGNTYDEQAESKKSKDVKEHSSKQKEQKIEVRNDGWASQETSSEGSARVDINNSGSNDKGNNSKSKQGEKGSSGNASQVEKDNSKNQGNSHEK